jgi:hypothetical protein
MPKILEEVYYDGARERLERLGLAPIMDEIKALLTGFVLPVKEERDANGGAEVRKRLDARFGAIPGWDRKTSGDIDWIKCHTVNGTTVCLGVEIQVSARSDLLVVDMIHLNAAFREGRIDVGVIVVPTDRLGVFLTDRGPCMSDAKKHAEAARLQDAPLILLAIEHDGPGPPLPKQGKRQSK